MACHVVFCFFEFFFFFSLGGGGGVGEGLGEVKFYYSCFKLVHDIFRLVMDLLV